MLEVAGDPETEDFSGPLEADDSIVGDVGVAAQALASEFVGDIGDG